MKQKVILLFLLLILSLNSSAQTSMLYIPSSQEYVDAMSGIWEVGRNSSFEMDTGHGGWTREYIGEHLIRLMESEFLYRYESEADTGILIAAYDILNQGEIVSYANYHPFISHVDWNIRIVQRWLEEHPTDFNEVDEIQFDNYTIKASYHNFDGKGEYEILLTVSSDNFSDHWLASRSPNSKSGYIFTSSPLPYRANGFFWSQPEGLGATTLKIEDVNNDGKDEWIAIGYSSFPGSGYISGYSRFYVLGLKDGQMDILTAIETKDIAASPEILPVSLSAIARNDQIWSFINVDKDPARELLQIEQHRDNWGCNQLTRITYNWNGFNYLQTKRREYTAPTFRCAIRQAEKAMLNYDYDAAIQHYLEALTRYKGNFTDTDGQLAAYAQERLVIAYALEGKIPEAQHYLYSLRSHPLLENTIAEQLLMLPVESFNRYSVCTTAYQFLLDNFQQYENPLYRNLSSIGMTEDNIHIYVDMRQFPQPHIAGCDIEHLITEMLNELQVTASPIEQLTAKGLEIEAFQPFDLNRDGQKEWLVWLSYLNKSIFLSPVQDHYHLSYPFIKKTQDYLHFETYPLPGEKENVLVTTIYGQENFYFRDGYTVCSSSRDGTITTVQGQLDLWQLKNNELVLMLYAPLCEYPNLDEIFQSDKLHVWGNRRYVSEIGEQVEPVIYQWNDDHYLVPQQQVETASQTDLYARYANIRNLYWDIFYRFKQDNFEDVLELSGQVLELEQPFGDDFYLLMAVRYYRALAFEALNQPDQALYEYMQIYEIAPESAWGMLAELHFEVTTGK